MTDTHALRELREEIDALDEAIADLVAERVAVAEDVADVKSARDLDLVDQGREAAVRSHLAGLFEKRGLAPEAGAELAAFLIERSLQRERAVEDDA